MKTLENMAYATKGKFDISKSKKRRTMKKVYRWAIAHFIGIAGMVSTMCGAWFAYFTYNNDWWVLSLFGALVTWFYIEVVTPEKK